MAFDEALAERVRIALSRRRGVVEKRMFGGLGFMTRGNLCVCVWKDSLIVRLGRDGAEAALDEPHAGPFDITGKAMSGWVLVAPEGVADDEELADWVGRAWRFTRTLPAK